MGVKSKFIISNFGQDIKMIIIKQGITFKEFAEKVGINVSQLNKFLDGYAPLNAKYHNAVCTILGLDLEEFKKWKIVRVTKEIE